jgi:RNA polymerase sigma factor (sigma-70 family)
MPTVLRATPPQPVREGVPARPSRERSDETLLAGFAASDADATSAFVERFERRVFGLALTIVGERRAAEDVAQEAFLRAWRHAAVFDARRGGVRAWLLTITRNVAIDAVRARRPVTVDPDDLLRLAVSSSGRDAAQMVVVRDEGRRVRDALSGLPDEQRRAVVLACVWGLTAREIAEREEIPLGTAKTRIRTGLIRLRRALTNERSGDGANRAQCACRGDS